MAYLAAMASTYKKYNLDGKVALVTGSSSGIGEACAVQLAQYGAKLTIHGRDANALSKVADRIRNVSGSQPLQICGDLANETMPIKLINETVSHYGRLDILVNNAGKASGTDSLLDPNIMATYDSVFQVNVRAVLDLTRLAVPHLEKTKGNIINISSTASIKPYVPIYSTSKAAVDMLTKTTAQELGEKGIRCNAICPGPVVTKIYRSLGFSEFTDEQQARFVQRSKEMNALDKVAEPNDIANLVSFLASDDASNITGSIILNDTGSLVKKAALAF